jgi:hypothetical protein
MTNRFTKEQHDTTYPEDHGTNEWLRIIANEQAKTNRLLQSLVDSNKKPVERKGSFGMAGS